MADSIEKGQFSTLQLGIQDTEILGSYEAAEAFLSDTPISEIKKDEEKPKPKEEEKPELKLEEEEEVDPLKDEFKDDEEEDSEKKDEEGQDPALEYSALAKDLLRLGIFTELEDEKEIKTPEDLLERFQIEKQMGATSWLENFLSKFGDDRREMFEAIYINGADPKEYVPVFNEVQNFEGLDLTVEDNQKKVFREYFKTLGWSQEQIEKKLVKAIDYGDLEEESTLYHEKLVSDNKKKLEEISARSKQQEELNKKADIEYKSNIQKILSEAIQKREFKGFPLTQAKANEVFDFLYSPKYKTADNKILTEFDKFILESKKPENIESRILIGLLKSENFDFSKIEKNAISKESKGLFSELAQKQVKSKTRDLSKIQVEDKKSSWATKL